MHDSTPGPGPLLSVHFRSYAEPAKAPTCQRPPCMHARLSSYRTACTAASRPAHTGARGGSSVVPLLELLLFWPRFRSAMYLPEVPRLPPCVCHHACMPCMMMSPDGPRLPTCMAPRTHGTDEAQVPKHVRPYQGTLHACLRVCMPCQHMTSLCPAVRRALE